MEDVYFWYLVKNDPPNCFNCVNGFLVSIARTLPGIFPGSPFGREVHIKYCLGMIVTIVNYMKCVSGRLWSNPHPWVFLLKDVPVYIEYKERTYLWYVYFIKVVFPVEYCPTIITSGFPSKSASSSLGEWNSWKTYSFSNGSK